MTDEELTRLEALAAAASAGPWLNEVEGCVGIRYAEGGQATICTCPIASAIRHNGLADAAFIAAAREAVPALIAEVRRLKAENETKMNLLMDAVAENERLRSTPAYSRGQEDMRRRAAAEAKITPFKISGVGCSDEFAAGASAASVAARAAIADAINNLEIKADD